MESYATLATPTNTNSSNSNNQTTEAGISRAGPDSSAESRASSSTAAQPPAHRSTRNSVTGKEGGEMEQVTSAPTHPESLMKALQTLHSDVEQSPALQMASPSSVPMESAGSIVTTPPKRKRGRPPKYKQAIYSSEAGRTIRPAPAETRQQEKSTSSVRGRRKSSLRAAVGATTSTEFQTSTKILKRMLQSSEAPFQPITDSPRTGMVSIPLPAQLNDSSVTSDDLSLGDVGEYEEEEEEEETQKRKKEAEDLQGEEGDMDEWSPTKKPPKKRVGRPPKKRTAQKSKNDSEKESPAKRMKLEGDIERLPGTKLKICTHCGTVSEKVKAKKCHNCQKFFFTHWAQRCKIPPCPICHYSRKSRRFERVPSNCEKCGYKLSGELLEGALEEGDGGESEAMESESTCTSVRETPEPSEAEQVEPTALSVERVDKGLVEVKEAVTQRDGGEEGKEEVHVRVDQRRRGRGEEEGAYHVDRESPRSSRERGAEIQSGSKREGGSLRKLTWYALTGGRRGRREEEGAHHVDRESPRSSRESGVETQSGSKREGGSLGKPMITWYTLTGGRRGKREEEGVHHVDRESPRSSRESRTETQSGSKREGGSLGKPVITRYTPPGEANQALQSASATTRSGRMYKQNISLQNLLGDSAGGSEAAKVVTAPSSSASTSVVPERPGPPAHPSTASAPGDDGETDGKSSALPEAILPPTTTSTPLTTAPLTAAPIPTITTITTTPITNSTTMPPPSPPQASLSPTHQPSPPPTGAEDQPTSISSSDDLTFSTAGVCLSAPSAELTPNEPSASSADLAEPLATVIPQQQKKQQGEKDTSFGSDSLNRIPTPSRDPSLQEDTQPRAEQVLQPPEPAGLNQQTPAGHDLITPAGHDEGLPPAGQDLTPQPMETTGTTEDSVSSVVAVKEAPDASVQQRHSQETPDTVITADSSFHPQSTIVPFPQLHFQMMPTGLPLQKHSTLQSPPPSVAQPAMTPHSAPSGKEEEGGQARPTSTQPAPTGTGISTNTTSRDSHLGTSGKGSQVGTDDQTSPPHRDTGAASTDGDLSSTLTPPDDHISGPSNTEPVCVDLTVEPEVEVHRSDRTEPVQVSTVSPLHKAAAIPASAGGSQGMERGKEVVSSKASGGGVVSGAGLKQQVDVVTAGSTATHDQTVGNAFTHTTGTSIQSLPVLHTGGSGGGVCTVTTASQSVPVFSTCIRNLPISSTSERALPASSIGAHSLPVSSMAVQIVPESSVGVHSLPISSTGVQSLPMSTRDAHVESPPVSDADVQILSVSSAGEKSLLVSSTGEQSLPVSSTDVQSLPISGADTSMKILPVSSTGVQSFPVPSTSVQSLPVPSTTGSGGANQSVLSNVAQTLPLFHSVVNGAQCLPITQAIGTATWGLPVIGSLVHKLPVLHAQGSGTQSLPTLYTSTLGLQMSNKPREIAVNTTAAVSEENQPVIATATAVSSKPSLVPGTQGSLQAVLNEPTAVQTPPLTESRPSASISLISSPKAKGERDPKDRVKEGSSQRKERKEVQDLSASLEQASTKPAPHKSPKGKKTGGKEGKTGKEGKASAAKPKKQGGKNKMEGTEGNKSPKEKKPRASSKQKSKTPAPVAVSTSAPTSVLLVPELQHKKSLSPLASGQPPYHHHHHHLLALQQHQQQQQPHKHTFSQYFYSDELSKSILSSSLPATTSVSTGLGSSAALNDGAVDDGKGKGKSKRVPPKHKELQEPLAKRKKLATIAPSSPRLPSSYGSGGLATQAVKGSTIPSALLPQLSQLAAVLKMSSTTLLSTLQSPPLGPNTPGQGAKHGVSAITTSIAPPSTISSSSLSSVSSPLTLSTTASTSSLKPGLGQPSLSAGLFPMTFQSLAAALSSMPMVTTPVRLPGTQVTARPLLPTSLSTSSSLLPTSNSIPFPITSLSMPLPTSLPLSFPLSLPSSFPPLAAHIPLITDQTVMHKGTLSSEASVGTQTAEKEVKMDTLKPVLPIPSSLSPQHISLLHPPQLTSHSPSQSAGPPLLKPLFPSALPQSQLHSSPPPLTSHSSPSSTTSMLSSHPPVSSVSLKVPEQKPFTITEMSPSIMRSHNAPHTLTPTALPSVGTSTLTAVSIPLGHSPIVSTSGKDFSTQTRSVTKPLSALPPASLLVSRPSSAPSRSSLSPTTVLPSPPQLLPSTLVASPPPSQPTPAVADLQSNPIIPSLLVPGSTVKVSVIATQLSSTLSSSSVMHPLPGTIYSSGVGSPPYPSISAKQKVIYTQTITTPKVCPVPQPPPTITEAVVDSSLQVLTSSVQSRIKEALSKPGTASEEPESLAQLHTSSSPVPAVSVTAIPPLAPPPLTSTVPLGLVSKAGNVGTSPYPLSHPHPPPLKRGVVITKLSGPLTNVLTGDSMRVSTAASGSKNGEDPQLKLLSSSTPISGEKADGTASKVASSSKQRRLNVSATVLRSPSPSCSFEEVKQTPAGAWSTRSGSATAAGHAGEGVGGRSTAGGEESEKDEGYTKLLSEETLASEPSSDGEAVKGEGRVWDGGGSQSQQQQQQTGNAANNTGDGGGDDNNEEEQGEKGDSGKDHSGTGGGGEGDGAGEGDRGKGGKKRRKSSSGGSNKKIHMFSVKLKDCFLHHLAWLDYRMVLLVPLGDKQQPQQQHQRELRNQQSPEAANSGQNTASSMKSSGTVGGSGEGGGGGGGGSGERRRRRKPVLKELSSYNEMEEDEDDTSASTTSSLHVPGPCFSVYELRNKLFQTLSPNAVYIYTYKNQIKSFKLPIHWVYILKRMGGMLDSCHTCRLMDLVHVRGMCETYGLHLPDSLEPLCRNELPKGRKVIDLSAIEPENLGPLHLEQIPACSFNERGKPHKPKKSSRKRARKEEEQSLRRSGGGAEDGRKELEDQEYNQAPHPTSGHSKDAQREEEEMEEEEEEDDDNWAEENNVKEKHKSRRSSPPPLIKQPPSPLTSRGKKKPCPFCGAQVLKRSKKCSLCHRNFGVYTFGRRQCIYCGRVNLARMSRCNECGESLDKAPIARPKGADNDVHNASLSHKKSDFIFGVRKRRRVHSVPLAFSGSFQGFMSPRTKKMELQSSRDISPVQSDTGEGGEEEEGERDDQEEGEEEEEAEEEMIKSTRKLSRGRPSMSAKSRHAGYQYGRIPWADADITVLVDEKGVPKFCLQELAAKVLAGHTKAEVFDMVKDLDLPLEHGDTHLLKKLQALGLHSNRSPICRLIASEELWLLLDALQEPVPEEVHQHLENINTSTTPLMSPGSTRTPAVVASAPPATNNEEDEHAFESTLHEMHCSDGQRISVLCTWDGEQYTCLPELWRKYFPEVNRNHLSSALRRLVLETHMPTAQQATLLRSAQVISVRGAPGRLMKLKDMQTLLDDFCIPLQIVNGPTKENLKEMPPSSKSVPSTQPVLRPRIQTNNSLPVSSTVPKGKALVPKEELEYASCMHNVLTAIDTAELVTLLEKSRLESAQLSEEADREAAELDSKMDRLSQLIHTRRELCQVLSKEMGFLTASIHGYMLEVVRLGHTEKLVVQNLDTLLHSMDVSFL